MVNKEKTITIALEEYNRLLECQKQVDELKQEKLDAVCDLNMRIIELDNELKQAVKDTAKEILQELWDETEPIENDEWIREKIKGIAERKGVEVE